MTNNNKPHDDAEAARKRRLDQIRAKMPDRHIEDVVRAYHPYAADSDEGTKAMLADFERLTKEQAERDRIREHADKEHAAKAHHANA